MIGTTRVRRLKLWRITGAGKRRSRQERRPSTSTTTRVTPEFFRVFHVQPAVGREFVAEEANPGGTGAVIISSAYATSHFGTSSNALGHKVRLAGQTLDIVGVM